MTNQFAKFSGIAYALLRIVSGLMFAMHGTQKLFGFPTGSPVQVVSLMGLAGVIELVTGVLIAVGFRTRWAAFLASGQMAVAYFMAHASQSVYPIMNRGELAVLYCFVFLYMAAHGSGPWSLDGGRRR
jgi:putative oxidoreductase